MRARVGLYSAGRTQWSNAQPPGEMSQRCPGKLHPQLREPLVQAFKSYDEAGVPRRIHCLKYLVLASMLMGSQVRV